MYNLANSLIMLTSTSQIQKDPGIIVGPITALLRPVLNSIYNLVHNLFYSMGIGGLSFGIAIILFTFVIRIIMIPLAIKQQKSMANMQKLQPEIEKIKKKYADKKDPEIQRKMNAEIQSMYAEHKINPFGGCLPILVQLPVFITLSYMLQHTYLFISRIGQVYETIADEILKIPNFVEIIVPLAISKVPKGMSIDVAEISDLQKVINKFRVDDWNSFLSAVPIDQQEIFTFLLQQKDNMEYFLGINLVENSGYLWPGILIPVLSAVTGFLTMYLTVRKTKSTDQQAMMQQRIMLYVMPLVMGFMTIGFPAGVGLYWVTSSVFQLFQQLYLDKKSSLKNKNTEKTS